MRPILFRVVLLVVLAGAFHYLSYTQETPKKDSILPDGTEGVVFHPKPIDTVLVNAKETLAPNEFKGTYSTFRIGFGYIGDFTTYIQDDVFKRQMDSLGVSLDPTFKTRDFRILG